METAPLDGTEVLLYLLLDKPNSQVEWYIVAKWEPKWNEWVTPGSRPSMVYRPGPDFPEVIKVRWARINGPAS